MQPIAADKHRILTQLRANLMNFSDDADEVEAMRDQLAAQVSAIITTLHTGNFRTTELIALLSLVGPIRVRTPLGGIHRKGKRVNNLRAV